MPTYDYECRACGHRFEAFQSITEGALRKCPECKKLKLKRLIGTGAGVIFRGSGFYETDYRSSSYQDAAKKESSGEGKADGGAPSSKDSKDSSGSDSKAKSEGKPGGGAKKKGGGTKAD